MAKWGEGDPRWIVEERPDATNVNNWHWSEKNADSWSKARLTELLTGFEVPVGGGGGEVVTISEVQRCEGEARVNNRKAKLIYFYEWSLKLAWKCSIKDVEGTLEVPNLSEEHQDINDVDIEVSLTSTSTSKEAQNIKEFMRVGPGAEAVRSRLQNYVDSLKDEFGQNLILPAKDKTSNNPGGPKSNTTTTVASALKINKSTSSSSSTSSTAAKTPPSGMMKGLDISSGGACKIPTGTIDMTETFTCTGQELYNVLTQRDMMRVFSGGDVKMAADEAKKGEAFDLLGGNVQGSFEELVPFTRVAFKWRLRSWPEAHFSQVRLEIQQRQEDTVLVLKQTMVPEKEVEATRSGWKRYYWDAIKRSFGFGFGFGL